MECAPQSNWTWSSPPRADFWTRALSGATTFYAGVEVVVVSDISHICIARKTVLPVRVLMVHFLSAPVTKASFSTAPHTTAVASSLLIVETRLKHQRLSACRRFDCRQATKKFVLLKCFLARKTCETISQSLNIFCVVKALKYLETDRL